MFKKLAAIAALMFTMVVAHGETIGQACQKIDNPKNGSTDYVRVSKFPLVGCASIFDSHRRTKWHVFITGSNSQPVFSTQQAAEEFVANQPFKEPTK